jgi:hypothetical protein
MPNWSELQADFASALLDPRRPVPPAVVDPRGAVCARRFGVYRNNVTVGLSGALAESFPAVRRLVGDEFFRAMAVAYARAEPPRSPVMAAYGEGFPAFVADFEPARGLPYLADVARIEQAWVEAYHAAEAAPLDPEAFTRLAPEALPHLRLRLHPSLRIVRSAHAALSIWTCNTETAAMEPVQDPDGPEDVLILRPDAEVEVRALGRGGAPFLLALLADETVVEAFGRAVQSAPGFDLGGHLAGLMDMGAIVGFDQ